MLRAGPDEREVLTPSFIQCLARCIVPLAVLLATAVFADAPVDPPLAAVETPHFRLLHEPGTADTRALAGRLEGLLPRFQDVCREAGFRVRTPEQAFTWVCFERPERYARVVAKQEHAVLADDAWYSTHDNAVMLMLRPSGQGGDETDGPGEVSRINHECAHQFAYNSGLQRRGVLYPLWFSEGLATHFETTDLHAFLGDNAPRRRALLNATREGTLLPLRQLVVVVAPGDDHERGVALYAQAWGLIQFLFSRDPARFREYACALTLCHPGQRPPAALEREFASAFGPAPDLEAAWHSFLRELAHASDAAPAPNRALPSDLQPQVAVAK